MIFFFRIWPSLFLGVILFSSCQQDNEKQNDGNDKPAMAKVKQRQDLERPPGRTIIAFGSCSKQYNPNQRWMDILKNDPDIWIWLGDNIYGDTHDMKFMAEKYDHQKADSGYQLLLKSRTQIIGTWDDHDYGINDGGKHFSKKEESKKLFMNFLDIPSEHPIHQHQGVYQSYDYSFDNHLLQIILLDTRYFRDTIYKNFMTRAYQPNEEGDILGEQQWQWFEQKLQESDADLILVGSSIQVIPEEHDYEKWANFPAARKRLFNLLTKYPDKRVVFISGDRHIAEISELQWEGLNYPLYDITSSGLTHTWLRETAEPNQYRVSDFIIHLNFGLIIIDWDPDKDHKIAFQIKGEGDTLLYDFKPGLFSSK
jgi:alkaline phosphatase D